MVAKEQDYVPSPDGLEADYSVYNIRGEGVWIVEPWATESGDYIKSQEIVIPK
jgi:ABC-type transporter MlaC component